MQWAHEHIAWQAYWHQVAFSDESCFNLWDHEGRIRVRRYAGIRGAIFQQDNARPDVAKTVRDLCSVQRIYFLVLLIHQIYRQLSTLDGRRLARDLRPAASKDELLLRMQAIWNSLPQADIQNLFDSIPPRIATLFAARVGYTKY
ncbi:transposable element Tcb2 transposase [Trichonephila clavipes]|nr:transposable element Tcb2 transposase [Trichonephila clavipes]